MRKIKLVILFIGLFFLPIPVAAQNISDYLILQNIGSYKFSTQSVNPVTDEIRQVPGYHIIRNAGKLMGADHFLWDHHPGDYHHRIYIQLDHLAMKLSKNNEELLFESTRRGRALSKRELPRNFMIDTKSKEKEC